MFIHYYMINVEIYIKHELEYTYKALNKIKSNFIKI